MILRSENRRVLHLFCVSCLYSIVHLESRACEPLVSTHIDSNSVSLTSALLWTGEDISPCESACIYSLWIFVWGDKQEKFKPSSLIVFDFATVSGRGMAIQFSAQMVFLKVVCRIFFPIENYGFNNSFVGWVGRGRPLVLTIELRLYCIKYGCIWPLSVRAYWKLILPCWQMLEC